MKGLTIIDAIIDKVIEYLRRNKGSATADRLDAWNYLEKFGSNGITILSKSDRAYLKKYYDING